MKNFLILFLLSLTASLPAQTDTLAVATPPSPLQLIEAEMRPLALAVLTDTIQENRVSAHQQLKAKIEKALQMDGAFDYPFDSIPSISFQYPEDRKFRVISWQLYVDINDYRYAGYIQTNAPQPQLMNLTDQAKMVEDPEYDVLDADNWFGAVYYNIKSFKRSGEAHYLLFGFNGHQLFEKRKIADVLFFDEGRPTFGAPVFQSSQPDRPDLTKNRIVLTYSAETYVRLNFDESLQLLVFDNLLTGTGSVKGQGPVLLPDGSYRGYELKKGNWVHVEKLFDHTYEKAPRPAPVLGKGRQGRDVFGND